jgi:histidinol dehydrogenase
VALSGGAQWPEKLREILMIPIFELPVDIAAVRSKLAPRKRLFVSKLIADVLEIFEQVRQGGDSAVRQLTLQFDGVQVSDVRVPRDFVARASESLPDSLRKAVLLASSHIEEVNKELLPQAHWDKQIRPGTVVGERVWPLESVGLWIPSRKGRLISSALMLIAAAKVAGVKRIVVATPPQSNGLPDPFTVGAAALAGANEFLVGGGVAIIAGLTLGTDAIEEVDGIYGPGPDAIAIAMGVAYLHGKRAPMGIGPTDCLVLADETADARLLAWDLVNEGEHGPDSSTILVTPSTDVARSVSIELERIIASAGETRRKYMTHQFTTDGRSALVVVPDWSAGCVFANEYAPEHMLVVSSPEREQAALATVQRAGEILLGPYTPFSAANYAIGVTAVLPTNGYARSFSGVTCRDMVRSTMVARTSREALAHLLPAINALAESEDLPFHALAVQARL